MGLTMDGQIQNGPDAGSPAPPTVQTPGANQGGRPAGQGGGPALGNTMSRWRSGIFTQPGGGGTVPAPPSTGAGGAAGSPPSSVPQPPAGSSGPQAAPPAPQGAPLQPGVVPPAPTLPAMPGPDEVAQLPPGNYETPMGTLVKGPDGSSRVVLNAAGQQQYRTRMAESVKAFGEHPFANDPGAPPPPVVPGAVSYNPFTNTFSDSTPNPPGMA